MGIRASKFRERVSAEVIDGVIRWRWTVVAVSLLLSLVPAIGIVYASFSSDYRVFFKEDDPDLLAFEKLQKSYQKEDNILVVVHAENGDLFTPARLSFLRRITEEFWTFPNITRVDSITNFQHSESRNDEVVIDDLFHQKNPSANDIEKIREFALSDPTLSGKLISADGRTAGLNLTLLDSSNNQTDPFTALKKVRQFVETLRSENPDLRFAITGINPLNLSFLESAMKDLGTLFPLVYAIILLLLFLMFPSFAAVSGTFLIIFLATFGAIGIGGWLGMPINPISANAPLIIATISTADSVHLLSSTDKFMRSGDPRPKAVEKALRVNFFPIVLTSITTAIGFLSLNFSDSPPFHHLGNIVATGTVIACFLSLTFLPAYLATSSQRSKPLSRFYPTLQGFGRWTLERVSSRPGRILLLFGLPAIAVTAWIPRLVVTDQFVTYFSEDVPFRADTDFVANHLTGIYQLEFSLPANGPGGVAQPEFMARTADFTDWLRSQPEVTHVQSITDVLKRLNKTMHGDDPAYRILPDSREGIAQYILLYEMSLPQGLDLRNQLNVDRSATRLIATVKNISTREIRGLEQRAENWLKENFPSPEPVEATGLTSMFSTVNIKNIYGMIEGTVTAIIFISLVVFLALRNVRLGLISLMPNALPALMAFGLWAMFVKEIGLSVSVVAAMTLGIIVDNTVHFLTKFRGAYYEAEKPALQAVREAYDTVTPAVLTSSVILVGGFAVLGLSSFEPNMNLGLLSVLTIGLALLTDLLMLPALLLKTFR